MILVKILIVAVVILSLIIVVLICALNSIAGTALDLIKGFRR